MPLLATPLLLAGLLATAPAPTPAPAVAEVVQTPLVPGLDVVEKHFLKEIPRAVLEERALRALVADLDAYSRYMDAGEMQDFRNFTQAHFGGIGVVLYGKDPTGYPRVEYLLRGGAALAAGLHRGDLLLSIDGRDLHGLDIDVVSDALRGTAGTPVRLQLRRAPATAPIAVALNRVEIQMPSVQAFRRDAQGEPDWWLDRKRKLGYLRVASLSEDTTRVATAALAQLHRGGARGLVLDLRDCAGGLMREALATADLFVGRGRLLTVRQRSEDDVYDAKPGEYTRLPMVLLINHGTASSGEILAGAIADNGRARMVGERSFGKGRVQTIYSLGEGRGGMVLSNGTFQRPNGTTIDKFDLPEDQRETGAGIAPDIEVKMTEAEHAAWLEAAEKRGGVLVLTPEEQQATPPDPQLAKALELLPR
jgi:carboxyl-terminal processing protease